MIINTPKLTIGAIRLSILAATALTLGACASTGGYTNTTDDSYGKKSQAAATEESSNNTIKAPLSAVESSIGPVIGGSPNNLTLYFFDKDTPNVSVCNDGCAAAWPPFMVADPSLATAKMTMVTRSDGSLQWALDGKPLYFWAGDQTAGDTTGAAVPDWTVVTPDAL